MGVVYEARRTTGGSVAIKILKPEKLSDESAVTDFRNEAETTAVVDHECVVDILGRGREGDREYIVMEFVDGPPLDRLLEPGKRVRWQTATKVVKQVARALGHAHGLGLIHRDVKPGNILLYRDGRARVTDFGIVKDISTLKGYLLNGKQVGTSLYASPEQVLGKRLGPGTDMYSLGVTFYQMVCGRTPFTGKTQQEILAKHVKARLHSPLKFAPDLPKALSNAIEKMLAKKVADRPESMDELVANLDLILDGKVAIAPNGAGVNRKALRGLKSTRSGWRRSRGA